MNITHSSNAEQALLIASYGGATPNPGGGTGGGGTTPPAASGGQKEIFELSVTDASGGRFVVDNPYGWYRRFSPNRDVFLNDVVAGDVLEAQISFQFGLATDTVAGYTDLFHTSDSGGDQISAWSGAGLGSNSAIGLLGLVVPAGQPGFRSATYTRKVRAEEIDATTKRVRMSLCWKLGDPNETGGTKNLYANPASPLSITVINHGQPAT